MEPDATPSTALGERVESLLVDVEAAEAAITSAQSAAVAARAALLAAQAALVEETELAGSVFNLPMNCLELIFQAVPYDSRLRCREVSKSWRALLEGMRMWASPGGHVCLQDLPVLASDALLSAVLARAGARCKQLSLSSRKAYTLDSVASAVASRPNLTTLNLRNSGNRSQGRGDLDAMTPDLVRRLAQAAPHLKELRCFLNCTAGELHALVSNPPVASLKIGFLRVSRGAITAPITLPQTLAALLASQQGALHTLHWNHIISAPADFSALVDAVCALKLRTFRAYSCVLRQLMLPPLTRLLTDNPSLRDLSLRWAGLTAPPQPPLAPDASLSALCDGLRTCSLNCLALTHMKLWAAPPVVGDALMDSLCGHPTLVTLIADYNAAGPGAGVAAAAGRALARLLDSSPRLTTLSISHCAVGDEWAAPLFAAVARSTTLQSLYLVGHAISNGCAQNVVWPAVQANTSLRRLEFFKETDAQVNRFLAHAEGLVKSRTPAL